MGPFDTRILPQRPDLDAATRRKILEEYGTLFRGGWLLLGGAETAAGVERWFDSVAVGNATVYVAR